MKYRENIILTIISFILAPVFYGLALFNKKNNRPSRFLVIQTAKIGDLVCSTPVFREIKKKYPDSFLAVLVIPQTAKILENNPHIDKIILFDRAKYQGIGGVWRLVRRISSQDFDWAISLVPGFLNTIIPFWAGIPHRLTTVVQGAGRAEKLLSRFNNYHLEYKKNTLALRHYLNLLRFIDIREYNEEKEIFVSPSQTKKALDFFKIHHLGQGDLIIGVGLTAGKKFKQWPLEKFAQLADELIDRLRAKIIFIASRGDEAAIEKTRSLMKNQTLKADNFDLLELAALLQKISLFISVDTGPLYIADALDVPVVDIAGPCSMESQRPSHKYIIVQKPVICGPCSFIMSAPSYCRNGDLTCLNQISVDDVFQAVEKLLKN